jgi:multicomponent K+:H+ antiporter subunit F
MLNAALVFAFACIGLALLLNLVRLVRGPGLADRILALDTMYINTIALLIVYGIYADLAIFFEAALLIALMGFISTVALCKYLLRGDIIE